MDVNKYLTDTKTEDDQQTPNSTDLSELAVNSPPRAGSNPMLDMLPLQSSNADLQQAPNGVQMDSPPAGAPQDTTPPGLNYNNSGAVNAVQQALSGAPPRGGMANPGVYGLLPAHLQHGTLRNVLGALGDAFLVGSNRQAQYEPRMQRQELGNAMAGLDMNDPQSVSAAIQRIAGTGATGAPEMADRIMQQSENAALRKAVMEQTGQYRQAQTDSRHDSALARMTPYIGGMVAGAKDQASYAAAYQRAEAIAQRIGPDYHASDFGLVDPQDWTPGSTATAGMTANNVQTSGDRGAQRDVSVANNIRTNASRERSASISGGAHIAASTGAASISISRPSDTIRRQQLGPKIDAGTATPSEQQEWAHLTQVSGRGHRALPAGVAPGGGAPHASGGFQEGRVYKDAHGNRARYVHGNWVPQ